MSDLDPLPLQVGLRHSETMTVDERHVVPALASTWPELSDMPPAFATAMMIAFMEYTCIQGLKPYLTDAQRTLGIHVDVAHLAATPIGMKVTATVELTETDGRSLTFKVHCVDEVGPIGEGTHRRAIVDGNRFVAKLNQKAVAA